MRPHFHAVFKFHLRKTCFAVFISTLTCLYAQKAAAASVTDEKLNITSDAFDASVTRGALVFSLYCSKCHGVDADGNGRAAKKLDIKPANLRKSMAPDLYKEMIIRQGGKAMARSESMPPFDGELTQEQLKDVINYLRYIAPANATR